MAPAYQKNFLDASLLQKLDGKADERLVANVQESLWRGGGGQRIELVAEATNKQHSLLGKHAGAAQMLLVGAPARPDNSLISQRDLRRIGGRQDNRGAGGCC